MNQDQEEAYFQYLTELYERNPQFTSELPEILKGRTMEGDGLDIGCGMGHTLALLHDRLKVFGIDINTKMLQFGRRKMDVRNTTTAVGTALPFKSESFDWVLANQVIEHVPDYELFVQEIFRVLRPGGKAYTSTPNRWRFIRPWRPIWMIQGLRGKIIEDPTHVHEFTYGELHRLFKQAFTVEDIICTGVLLSSTSLAISMNEWPKFITRYVAANFDVIAQKP